MTATIAAPVSVELHQKLVRRVEKDHHIDRDLASRIVDQALAFLGTCAVHAGKPLAPSGLVDHGWHAFILHTRDYAEFCDRVAGRFLHHVPTDPDDSSDGAGSLEYTVDAIVAAGFRVDRELWSLGAKCNNDGDGKCHQCHAGCFNSP